MYIRVRNHCDTVVYLGEYFSSTALPDSEKTYCVMLYASGDYLEAESIVNGLCPLCGGPARLTRFATGCQWECHSIDCWNDLVLPEIFPLSLLKEVGKEALVGQVEKWMDTLEAQNPLL